MGEKPNIRSTPPDLLNSSPKEPGVYVDDPHLSIKTIEGKLRFAITFLDARDPDKTIPGVFTFELKSIGEIDSVGFPEFFSDRNIEGIKKFVKKYFLNNEF